MAKPRGIDKTVVRARIDTRLSDQVVEILADPLTGRLRYGGMSSYLEDLIRRDLERDDPIIHLHSYKM